MDNQSIEFLEANIHNWHTAQNGYVRNLDITILKKYESIYKNYVQSNFILTAWCSGCVLDMIVRLYRAYEAIPKKQIVSVDLPTEIFNEEEAKQVEEYVKKRGRKSKKNNETSY